MRRKTNKIKLFDFLKVLLLLLKIMYYISKINQ